MKKVGFVVLVVVALSFSLAGCKKSGEALWKDACDHAIGVMKGEAGKAIDEALKNAPGKAKKELEKSKKELDKQFEGFGKKCVEDFKKGDAKSADEAAACLLEAKDQKGMEECMKKMKPAEKKAEEKEEEKK